jgi:hypothetical protein
MRDAPVPVVAYIMVGLTSAVLAYVTYSDNSVPGQEKIQENTQSESNITPAAGVLTTAAAMLPALPAFFSGKKQEPPLAEAKIIEDENEQINENEKQQQAGQEQKQEQVQLQVQPVENEIKQTGGKKSKKNKTKNHKRLHKDNKNNKTKYRK